MIANKKEFGGGLLLMAAFWVVFAVLLSPVFAGRNLLDYMDGLYNSISKKSAYYIPNLATKAETMKGNAIAIRIKPEDQATAPRIAALLAKAGATAQEAGGEVAVSGDLGVLLAAALADADAMYANDGEALQAKYGVEAKQVMYDWWNTLKSMENSLNKQGKFDEGKLLYQIRTKATEPSYNYFGIEARSIKDKLVIVVLSLTGYVIYTMWFGFAILFMFEGWGLKLEH